LIVIVAFRECRPVGRLVVWSSGRLVVWSFLHRILVCLLLETSFAFLVFG
jgi:hypothetical protein